VFDSQNQDYGYGTLMDYHMSKTFGLEWKEHDCKRMQEFYQIMSLTAKRRNLDAEKANKKAKGGKRGR